MASVEPDRAPGRPTAPMRDHLRLVRIAFREQRPDRTVDQAAGESFFLSKSEAFALDEAAGENVPAE